MLAAGLLACAMNVHPVTTDAVARVESGGNPLALHVNGLRGRQPRAETVAEAASIAESYIRRGFNVDLGVMQVNSRNLPALGLSTEQALDPCTNVRAGGLILAAGYARAVGIYGEGQPALRAALSAYNTGSLSRGFANGYVARYLEPGGVPAIAGRMQQVVTAPAVKRASAPSPGLSPYTAETQIYVREAMNVRVQ